jgi:ATP-dependent DNA ligase
MTSHPPSERARQVVGCSLAAAHCHPGVQSARRCLAFRTAEGVLLQSRQQRPLTRYFPEVAAALAAQPAPGSVLDGELVVYRTGRLDFTALQRRIHPSASHVARRGALTRPR